MIRDVFLPIGQLSYYNNRNEQNDELEENIHAYAHIFHMTQYIAWMANESKRP